MELHLSLFWIFTFTNEKKQKRQFWKGPSFRRPPWPLFAVHRAFPQLPVVLRHRLGGVGAACFSSSARTTPLQQCPTPVFVFSSRRSPSTHAAKPLTSHPCGLCFGRWLPVAPTVFIEDGNLTAPSVCPDEGRLLHSAASATCHSALTVFSVASNARIVCFLMLQLVVGLL